MVPPPLVCICQETVIIVEEGAAALTDYLNHRTT